MFVIPTCTCMYFYINVHNMASEFVSLHWSFMQLYIHVCKSTVSQKLFFTPASKLPFLSSLLTFIFVCTCTSSAMRPSLIYCTTSRLYCIICDRLYVKGTIWDKSSISNNSQRSIKSKCHPFFFVF